MPKVLIKSKVRKIFSGRQMSEEALEYIDEMIYNKLVEINDSKLDLLKGRITKDIMMLLIKEWE